MDGNLNALQKYHDAQEKKEVSYDCFVDSIDDELVELQNSINELQARAKEYDGYDFTEELNNILKDLI